jgi:hypothetical protein
MRKSFLGAEDVEESLLWEFDAAHLLHLAFALFLILEVFHLAFVMPYRPARFATVPKADHSKHAPP